MEFNREIEIGGKRIGNGRMPYIIAEMACAHNGERQQAMDLTRISAEAGADAVQLQFFVPEHTVTPTHEVFDVLKRIGFNKRGWKEVFDYGKSLGLDVWVCTYDVPSVEWTAEFGADGIKLNSADLSNPDVLRAVGQSKIPFTLGTGASTPTEIQRGLATLFEAGARDAVLMHGVQNFPTKRENLNVSRVQLLQRMFPGLPVGYADHTDGDDPFGKVVDLLAVGMGAAVLEKHITLSRADKGIDYQAALEPDEFKAYVERMRMGYEAWGQPDIKPLTSDDLRYRKFQKKSIVAATDLAAGTVLTRDHVLFLRNAEPGMAPIDWEQLEGKVLAVALKQYDNVLTNALR